MSTAQSPLAKRDQERIDTVLGALDALLDDLLQRSALISAIADESGLHPTALKVSLVRWGRSIQRPHLTRLLQSARSSQPGKPRVLTLAPGNVPVVAAECLMLGVLAGVSHDVALSSRAHSLAEALGQRLTARTPALTAHLRTHVWRELPEAEQKQLLDGADRVVAYGTAQTVEWLAAHMRPGAILVPHGPSIAVAALTGRHLEPPYLEAAMSELVRDIATWDQRGCRSLHVLFAIGPPGAAEAVTAQLAARLDAVQGELPRGRLTPTEVTDRFLDGLTSRALGRVLEGSSWRVTLEDQPRVARPSPLGRTIRVLRIDSAEDMTALLQTLPAPVGCLAMAPDTHLPMDLSPLEPIERVALGTLQTPRFDRLHDGRHRLDELRA